MVGREQRAESVDFFVLCYNTTMWRKLGGYFLISLLSFGIGTVLLHSMALAQVPILQLTPTPAQPTVTPLPTHTPTPTATPTPLPTATPIPPTSTPVPPTNTPTPQPTIAVVSDLESLFTRFGDEYHVDRELLKKIARCESGFNSDAVNGPYVGMYQFMEQTWISNRSAMGIDSNPELRRSAEESIRTAAFMIGRGQQNAWANCL